MLLRRRFHESGSTGDDGRLHSLNMPLTDVFKALSDEEFEKLMRTISISRLKTYKLYESLKTRAHLPKLNTRGLRKVTPRFWERIQNEDDDLAADLAQAILVGNLDMIIEILDFLGAEHSDGFFDKDADVGETLKEDWQQRAYDHFKETYPPVVLLFYLNHLSWEVTEDKKLLSPAGV